MHPWQREVYAMPVRDLLPARRSGLPGIALIIDLHGERLWVVTSREMASQAAALHIRHVSPLEAATVADALLGAPGKAARQRGRELAALKHRGEAWPKRQSTATALSTSAGGSVNSAWWPGIDGACGGHWMHNGPTVGFLLAQLGAELVDVIVEGELCEVAA